MTTKFIFLVCEVPPYVPNSYTTPNKTVRLDNGSMAESIVDYSCKPNYYLVNENANVRFRCELGATWEPKKLISCIKGLTNLITINILI